MNIPIWEMFQGIYTLFTVEPVVSAMRIILILLGAVFVYYGFKGVLEGLIMIPMGIAMIGVNAGTMIIQAAQTGNHGRHGRSHDGRFHRRQVHAAKNTGSD